MRPINANAWQVPIQKCQQFFKDGGQLSEKKKLKKKKIIMMTLDIWYSQIFFSSPSFLTNNTNITIIILNYVQFYLGFEYDRHFYPFNDSMALVLDYVNKNNVKYKIFQRFINKMT